MLDKIKKAIGIGSVVTGVALAPHISEAKVATEHTFSQENTMIESIDDALYAERAMFLDDSINEKFKKEIAEIGLERVQILINKEVGVEKGVFQINFGNFISDDGHKLFDVIHTIAVEVDGQTLLNKYASEELLSNIIARELTELKKRNPKEAD